MIPIRPSAALLFILAPLLSFAAPTFKNTAVVKTIDLQGPITTETTTYTAQLIRLDPGESTATEFEVIVGNDEHMRAGWFEAREKKAGKLGDELAWRKGGKIEGSSAHSYIITLPIPLQIDSSITLTTTFVLTDSVTPKPATIAQNEDQYLLWKGDAGILSAYEMEIGRVKIKSPTPQILSYSEPPTAYTQSNPITKSGAVLTLGPYHSVPALTSTLSVAPFEVHYRFNDPVISVKELKRAVEVSHWGNNLNIEDKITLSNTGPNLKGHFSRIDYMRSKSQRKFPAQVLSDLTMRLPPKIQVPYVYDTIGNVSTTHFRHSVSSERYATKIRAASRLPVPHEKEESVLEMRPRYPIMGGWDYNFTIGWDQSLSESLRKTVDGQWVLGVGFLTALQGVQYESIQWDVILPEGARDISVELPFPTDTAPEKYTHTTYLDTLGRPAVRVIKERCTEQCAVPVYVKYTLPVQANLQKPLAVTVAALSFFVGAMALKRALPSDRHRGGVAIKEVKKQ
ncbi:Oligosaccharyltransferase, alpha subunit (ribophorin I) [Phaffia rhodozyma]|uniref:Dolichyl-diphosphooligosaccharide--protein glycosyltransferase subunit 1 n=1 Tax=Phaffia rhodozyma TaxID=264483 RepID=A0A0F7SS82_PHARH|nr:Oligosaccharyltransferase, alpha subunit (ribophorin I) [Phaffia rhodozyma]